MLFLTTINLSLLERPTLVNSETHKERVLDNEKLNFFCRNEGDFNENGLVDSRSFWFKSKQKTRGISLSSF